MSVDSNLVRKLLEIVRDNALDNGTEDYKKGFLDAILVVDQIVLDNAEKMETDSENYAKEIFSELSNSPSQD